MKNKKLLIILVLLLILFSSKVYAQDICSKNGYTILTINGMLTDKKSAVENKDKLKDRLLNNYNNQPIIVDYVYNATHIGGLGDLVDAVRQGLFDSKSDYDLVEMLDSASQKITTQKLLLVGHSQGNFYANNFYDKVVDKEGGVPSQSIGVYGVATPDDHVSGGGKYLTSDTDTVIAAVVGRLKNIMTPNTHIKLKKSDGLGHSFSDVYLKYRSEKIISDIKSSFDNLKINETQQTEDTCISPPKISILHEFLKVGTTKTDFFVNSAIKVVSFVYNNVNKTLNSLDTALAKLMGKNTAAVGLADNLEISDPIINNVATAEEPITIVEPPIVEVKTDPNPDANILIVNPVTEENTIVTDPIVETDTTSSHSHNSSNNDAVENNEEKEEIIVPVVTPVIPDTTPPYMILLGDSIVNIELNSVYNELGSSAVDEKDGVIIVIKSGDVDTSTLGVYTITYTATDVALNTSTLIRTINVIPKTVTIPPTEENNDDEEKEEEDTIAPVITLVGNNPLYYPRFTVSTYQSDSYIESGATAIDNVDGTDVEVVITGEILMWDDKFQTLTYTATDKAGNIATKTRDVRVSDRVYIAKYAFGNENGDGHDWKIWYFDGSNVYDWSDTYVNKYLHEEFKIETEANQFWCSGCLMRGIFKNDPREGFGTLDFQSSALERNPQSNHTGNTYDVSIQWDLTGYTTTISHNGINDSTTHVDVLNMNNDLWVGWDAMTNNFKRFPEGYWLGVSDRSKTGLEGGTDMTLTPYPIYDENAENTTPNTPPIVVTPTLSSEKLMKSFNFNSIQPNVTGVVDEANHKISLTVPYGTNVTTLFPSMIISDKATVLPANIIPQDFTNPVSFVVTAEDKTTETYVATVIISLPPVIVPPIVEEYVAPDVIDFDVNGSKGNLTLDPALNHPTISLVANKNVNWLTVTLEKIGIGGVYKTLQSNLDTCVDGASTCQKIWEGDLSSGGSLQNGEYKIRVRVEDFKDNVGATTIVHEEYLPITITVIGGVSGS